LGESGSVKASSELNLSSRTAERKKSYETQKPISSKKLMNSNNSSTPSTPSPTKVTSGYPSNTSDEDQVHECECPQQKHNSNINNNNNHNNNNNSNNNNGKQENESSGTSTSIRKSRSCRNKNPPRKPVCRHASSIQSIPTEKYTSRRGLYRVKSLESNHVSSHIGLGVGVGVGMGAGKGYKYHESSLPPWNPSTNLSNKHTPSHSPREQTLQDKKKEHGQRTPRGLDTKCVTKANGGDVDKGIKITTEVNKRKNTKFPDGKTVDEEVKTTTTVSVTMETPEEDKETSLLTKVKNLALEIGSLAKETYKLSQSSDSSDSLEKVSGVSKSCYPVSNGIHTLNNGVHNLNNGVHTAVSDCLYSGENSREGSNGSDFTDDSPLGKEETDFHSETEYLSSVFRKR